MGQTNVRQDKSGTVKRRTGQKWDRQTYDRTKVEQSNVELDKSGTYKRRTGQKWDRQT